MRLHKRRGDSNGCRRIFLMRHMAKLGKARQFAAANIFMHLLADVRRMML